MSSTHVATRSIPTSSPTSTPPVRLTRRGRTLVVVVLALLVSVAFLLGRTATSNAATDSAAPKPLAQTTVQPGETLWAVAKRVAPSSDPRSVVEQIRSLNHLAGGTVQVGQQLLLPRAA